MVSQSADNALRLHTVEMVLDIKIRLAFSLNRTDHAGMLEDLNYLRELKLSLRV